MAVTRRMIAYGRVRRVRGRRPRLWPLVLVVVLAAGCGGGEDGAASPSATPEAATAAGATAPGATGDATTADSGHPEEQVTSAGGPIGAPVQTQGGKGLPSCPNMNAPVTTANANASAASASCIINKLRRRRGIRALKDNAKLRQAAAGHAADMVSKNYFSHVSADGRGFVARVSSTGYMSGATLWRIGENLAWGAESRSTPASIVQAWLDSPGHRKNMLNRRYREAGMAVAAGIPTSGPDPDAGGTYVQEFGRAR